MRSNHLLTTTFVTLGVVLAGTGFEPVPASAFSMPMAGGGTASAQEFLRYRAMASARGLPDGRVVRIVTGEGNDETIITLGSVEPGPLPRGTFDPPDKYERMEMPSSPGLGASPGRR